MAEKSEISIIIVNWNAQEVLGECLKSIYRTVNASFEIIVVDNHSSDNSVSMIKEGFPEVKLIEEKENIGFAKANNIGFRFSNGKYVMLLNPDTELIDDAVEKMTKILDTHQEIGIVGPKILNKDGAVSKNGKKRLPTIPNDISYLFLIQKSIGFIEQKLSRLPFLKKQFYSYYEKSGECECLSGSCMMFKSAFFKEAGLFDETMPMYLDDIDICYRSLKSGRKNFYLADAKIIHLEQYSTRKSNDYKMFDILSMHSRLLFYKKHFGKKKVISYKMVVLMSIPYLLVLDIITMPYYLFLNKLAEKLQVVRKHLKYIDIVIERR